MTWFTGFISRWWVVTNHDEFNGECVLWTRCADRSNITHWPPPGPGGGGDQAPGTNEWSMGTSHYRPDNTWATPPPPPKVLKRELWPKLLEFHPEPLSDSRCDALCLMAAPMWVKICYISVPNIWGICLILMKFWLFLSKRVYFLWRDTWSGFPFDMKLFYFHFQSYKNILSTCTWACWSQQRLDCLICESFGC